MDRRVCDTERSLSYHACFLCILDRRYNVAWVVETTEDTSDVSALLLLYYIEELAYVLRTWAHAETVESAVEHVSLDACLVERLCPFTNRLVWVLSVEEVYLLETTTVSFNTVEATHLDDCWSNFYELVNAWLVLACTLPHIAENQ